MKCAEAKSTDPKIKTETKTEKAKQTKRKQETDSDDEEVSRQKRFRSGIDVMRSRDNIIEVEFDETPTGPLENEFNPDVVFAIGLKKSNDSISTHYGAVYQLGCNSHTGKRIDFPKSIDVQNNAGTFQHVHLMKGLIRSGYDGVAYLEEFKYNNNTEKRLILAFDKRKVDDVKNEDTDVKMTELIGDEYFDSDATTIYDIDDQLKKVDSQVAEDWYDYHDEITKQSFIDYCTYKLWKK